MLSTLFVAMAGYLLNDLYDVQCDAVNKPGKNFFAQVLKPSTGKIIYVVFNIIALVLAFVIGINVILFVLFMAILQWLYSAYLKNSVLIGNITVAFSQASVFLLVYLWAFYNNSLIVSFNSSIVESHQSNLLFFFTGFAFLTGLIREIVKDVEDKKGDVVQGYTTIATEYSINNIILLLKILSALLLLAVIGLSFYFLYHLNSSNVLNYFYLFIMIPITARMLVFLTKTDDPFIWKKLSQWIKVIMLAGVVSIYFIK